MSSQARDRRASNDTRLSTRGSGAIAQSLIWRILMIEWSALPPGVNRCACGRVCARAGFWPWWWDYVTVSIISFLSGYCVTPYMERSSGGLRFQSLYFTHRLDVDRAGIARTFVTKARKLMNGKTKRWHNGRVVRRSCHHVTLEFVDDTDGGGKMIATTLDVLSSLLESLHYLTMTLSVFLSHKCLYVPSLGKKGMSTFFFLCRCFPRTASPLRCFSLIGVNDQRSDTE